MDLDLSMTLEARESRARRLARRRGLTLRKGRAGWAVLDPFNNIHLYPVGTPNDVTDFDDVEAYLFEREQDGQAESPH